MVITSCSFRKVTTEPANDTEPTSTVKAVASRAANGVAGPCVEPAYVNQPELPL